ncbi:hypothetical protein MTO96_032254 [Rhipicephalus appendiculatus]
MAAKRNGDDDSALELRKQLPKGDKSNRERLSISGWFQFYREVCTSPAQNPSYRALDVQFGQKPRKRQAPWFQPRRHLTTTPHVFRLRLEADGAIVLTAKHTENFTPTLPTYPRVQASPARRRKSRGGTS